LLSPFECLHPVVNDRGVGAITTGVRSSQPVASLSDGDQSSGHPEGIDPPEGTPLLVEQRAHAVQPLTKVCDLLVLSLHHISQGLHRLHQVGGEPIDVACLIAPCSSAGVPGCGAFG